jgi:hypothetical protein
VRGAYRKGIFMLEKPKFLQGVYKFQGRGLDVPEPLPSPVSYKVPFDKRSQLVYFRAGNSSGELIYVVLMRDGKPMRYFPIGAKEWWRTCTRRVRLRCCWQRLRERAERS